MNVTGRSLAAWSATALCALCALGAPAVARADTVTGFEATVDLLPSGIARVRERVTVDTGGAWRRSFSRDLPTHPPVFVRGAVDAAGRSLAVRRRDIGAWQHVEITAPGDGIAGPFTYTLHYDLAPRLDPEDGRTVLRLAALHGTLIAPVASAEVAVGIPAVASSEVALSCSRSDGGAPCAVGYEGGRVVARATDLLPGAALHVEAELPAGVAATASTATRLWASMVAGWPPWAWILLIGAALLAVAGAAVATAIRLVRPLTTGDVRVSSAATLDRRPAAEVLSALLLELRDGGAIDVRRAPSGALVVRRCDVPPPTPAGRRALDELFDLAGEVSLDGARRWPPDVVDGLAATIEREAAGTERLLWATRGQRRDLRRVAIAAGAGAALLSLWADAPLLAQLIGATALLVAGPGSAFPSWTWRGYRAVAALQRVAALGAPAHTHDALVAVATRGGHAQDRDDHDTPARDSDIDAAELYRAFARALAPDGDAQHGVRHTIARVLAAKFPRSGGGAGLVALLAAASAVVPRPSLADTVDEYQAVATVGRGGAVDVQERFRYTSTAPGRGFIDRPIATIQPDLPAGARRQVVVLGVTDHDGAPVPYTTFDARDAVVVRLVDVTAATVDVAIHYAFDSALRRAPTHDEVIVDAPGFLWAVAVNGGTVWVEGPLQASRTACAASVDPGRADAWRADCAAVDGTRALFTFAPTDGSAGFGVAVGYAPGAVGDVSWAARAGAAVRWWWAVPLALAAGLLLTRGWTARRRAQ